MASKRTNNARTNKSSPATLLVKSWPATIESTIEGIVGTRGSRYRARISLINTAMRQVQAAISPVSSMSGPQSRPNHQAQDPRVSTLQSWAQISKDFIPRLEIKNSSNHQRTIIKIDKQLKSLHAEVYRIPGLNIQLSPASVPTSPMIQLGSKSADSTSDSEASPTIIMLEKKKGLFRHPDLFEFELWDDRKARFVATTALGRGPLFPVDANRIKKSSRYRKFPKNNMPQTRATGDIVKSVLVTGGSRLSFGEEINTTKDKFDLLDPIAQVLFIQNQENYEKPLSSYGQPLQLRVPLARLAASSSLLRNLLLDKHSGAFEDECDYVIYDPEKTLERKEYIHQITIYAQGLLFSEEVQKRSDNRYWDGLEENEFWWGLEVYVRWVTTGFVVLEGREGMEARGKAAVQTARFLGFDQDLEYWKALEDMVTMVGAPILTW